jgi:hypothetical protein
VVSLVTTGESQVESPTNIIPSPEDNSYNNVEDYVLDESRAELLAMGYYPSQKSSSYLILISSTS